RAGTDVIGHAEPSAPCARRHRSAQRFEQWLGVSVGNRKDGNLRNDGAVLDFEALRSFRRAHARSKRIARIDGIVGDASALDALFGPPGAVGERLTLLEAI